MIVVVIDLESHETDALGEHHDFQNHWRFLLALV
jgi:hypothetical protein